MSTFAVVLTSPLTPAQAFAAVTDWPAHSSAAPLTRVSVVHDHAKEGAGVGDRFVSRTALGRFGFDDPMEVVEWQPPSRCVVVKHGRVVRGQAAIEVAPTPGGGSRVTWRESARIGPRPLSTVLDPAVALVGPLVFRRVLRALLRKAQLRKALLRKAQFREAQHDHG